MDEKHKKRVFISYSWEDSESAEKVREAIPSRYEVWIDKERIHPGDEIAIAIKEGLDVSDYYVVLISENAVASRWVKREIATAFELADEKKLSVVPLLFEGAEIPIEFRGLLFIDFRKSFSLGLQNLRKFFLNQEAVIEDIEPQQIFLKSQDDATQKRMACNASLRKLQLGDLRYLVADRLSLDDVEVVWFDVFGKRMVDEVHVRNLALACVELIDRARRTQTLVDLMDTLCRNYPFISK